MSAGSSRLGACVRVCQRTGPRGRRHVRSQRHRHGRRPVGSRRRPVVPRTGPCGRRHRAIIATRSWPPPRRIAPPSRRRGGRVTTARSCHGGEAAVCPTLSRETASPLPNWARCRWSPYHYCVGSLWSESTMFCFGPFCLYIFSGAGFGEEKGPEKHSCQVIIPCHTSLIKTFHHLKSSQVVSN